MVSDKFIVKALEYNAKRISTLDPMEVENLIVGCCQILSQADNRLRDWLRGDRERLLKAKRLTKAKQRVLADLIAYTTSSVEAATWVDEWTLGALPTKSEPSNDPAVLESRRRASQAAAEGRRRAREAREGALVARIDFDSR